MSKAGLEVEGEPLILSMMTKRQAVKVGNLDILKFKWCERRSVVGFEALGSQFDESWAKRVRVNLHRRLAGAYLTPKHQQYWPRARSQSAGVKRVLNEKKFAISLMLDFSPK